MFEYFHFKYTTVTVAFKKQKQILLQEVYNLLPCLINYKYIYFTSIYLLTALFSGISSI